RASTRPLSARIRPRWMRSSRSRVRALSGLSRSEEASKTVQREVNATSSANNTSTSPKRRTIGWFTATASFQPPEFQIADQRRRVTFGAKRVIEQRAAAFGTERRGAHTGDELAAVERNVTGEPVGKPAEQRYQAPVVRPDEVD